MLNVSIYICVCVRACVCVFCMHVEDVHMGWHRLVSSVTSSLSHPATPCNTLQHPATPCNTLQHPATPYNNTLQQHTATHWSFATPSTTLQHTATTHCNILHHPPCNTLQHTATHCTCKSQMSNLCPDSSHEKWLKACSFQRRHTNMSKR